MFMYALMCIWLAFSLTTYTAEFEKCRQAIGRKQLWLPVVFSGGEKSLSIYMKWPYHMQYLVSPGIKYSSSELAQRSDAPCTRFYKGGCYNIKKVYGWKCALERGEAPSGILNKPCTVWALEDIGCLNSDLAYLFNDPRDGIIREGMTTKRDESKKFDQGEEDDALFKLNAMADKYIPAQSYAWLAQQSSISFRQALLIKTMMLKKYGSRPSRERMF